MTRVNPNGPIECSKDAILAYLDHEIGEIYAEQQHGETRVVVAPYLHMGIVVETVFSFVERLQAKKGVEIEASAIRDALRDWIDAEVLKATEDKSLSIFVRSLTIHGFDRIRYAIIGETLE